ncbi:MAG: hypothetical protein Q8M94_22770 [Ignavibacteria bacterium]|nr:hypothetical protein [Ignavibacteria bacterium]
MKLIRDLPDTCTTQEIISICDDLAAEGHKVVIEHQGGKIQLYDDSVSEGETIQGTEAFKRLFGHLARDAPSADSPHWGEYEETMRQLEELRRQKDERLAEERAEEEYHKRRHAEKLGLSL